MVYYSFPFETRLTDSLEREMLVRAFEDPNYGVRVEFFTTLYQGIARLVSRVFRKNQHPSTFFKQAEKAA